MVVLLSLFSTDDAASLARRFGDDAVALELGRDCAALDGIVGDG